MTVRELLKSRPREIVTIKPSAALPDAMALMLEHKVGCLPVLSGSGDLLGILDDKDIFRAIYEHQDDFAKYTAEQWMTADLIIGVPEDSLSYIVGLMVKNIIRYVPIMEKQKMIGLISQGDVVKAQMKHMEITNRYLKMYMEGTHLG